VGRVLSRLSPYRELGLSLEGRDHKKLQADLADLVPPNLRHGLHVNLVQHGRTIRTVWPPRCLRSKITCAQSIPIEFAPCLPSP
jgi:endonuclease III